MRLKIDGKMFSTSIVPSGDGYSAQIDCSGPKGSSAEQGKHIKKSGGQHLSVNRLSDGQFSVCLGNDVFIVELLGPHDESDCRIIAPIRGVVQSIAVSNDDWVRKGQCLIRIFAMKLQNEIIAESNCRVVQVFASPGQVVEKGQLLMKIVNSR